jgi:hypothetical protein
MASSSGAVILFAPVASHIDVYIAEVDIGGPHLNFQWAIQLFCLFTVHFFHSEIYIFWQQNKRASRSPLQNT